MRQITNDHLTALLNNQAAPCISIYMPTHRSHPDNLKDQLVYKNILKKMEKSLNEKYPAVEAEKLMEEFTALGDDKNFWLYRTESVAILGSPDSFQIFDLQRPVQELLVVADSFHIKPLLRILQSADRYHILYLNREEARLYEGNRDSLEQVEISDVPTTITDALGEELTESQLRVSSYGMRGSGAGDKAMYHGQGSRKEELRNDTVRFFRAIDRGILENYSAPSGLPLMVAGLKEHHADFRGVSHNPALMDDGLMVDVGAMDLDTLRAKAWEKIEPIYLQRLSALVDRYQSARPDQRSDSLQEAVAAALDGRIAVLLVEADKHIPGRVDAEARSFKRGELSDPETDDILDDLAELVLRNRGEVVIVPVERMPVSSGFAAIYRF